jgi:hypothetical protein
VKTLGARAEEESRLAEQYTQLLDKSSREASAPPLKSFKSDNYYLEHIKEQDWPSKPISTSPSPTKRKGKPLPGKKSTMSLKPFDAGRLMHSWQRELKGLIDGTISPDPDQLAPRPSSRVHTQHQRRSSAQRLAPLAGRQTPQSAGDGRKVSFAHASLLEEDDESLGIGWSPFMIPSSS